MNETMKKILDGARNSTNGEPFDATDSPMAVGALLASGYIKPTLTRRPDVICGGMCFNLTISGLSGD